MRIADHPPLHLSVVHMQYEMCRNNKLYWGQLCTPSELLYNVAGQNDNDKPVVCSSEVTLTTVAPAHNGQTSPHAAKGVAVYQHPLQ
jgi:hypothetical protein